jgi:transposase
MRGSDERSGALFSYVDLEARVPAAHPLRTIRVRVNEALRGLSPGLRDLYARIGRPSIPPEQLLRALLLQAFYSIRSERQLMERLEFDLLFRWFVGLGIDDPVWNHSTFSKNRDRLLAGDARSSHGKATTTPIRPLAAAGPPWAPPVASSATSSSTTATIHPSSLSASDFFNLLLSGAVPPPSCSVP